MFARRLQQATKINRFQRRASVTSLLLLLLALPSACGSGDGNDPGVSAQQLCSDLADTFCERVYECFSSDELRNAGQPSSVAACKARERELMGCSAASGDDLCEGSERFHEGAADSCVAQLAAASCKQLRDGDDYAPACDRVCSVE